MNATPNANPDPNAAPIVPSPPDLAVTRLAEAQYAAASAIYGSPDAASILSAIVVFGAKAYQDVHLALLEPDTSPSIMRVMAKRAGSAILPDDERRPLSSYPANEALSAIDYLYAGDIATDPFLTEDERAELRRQNMGAVLIVPLVSAQALSGLVFMANPTPVDTPIEILRGLRTLADQTAVVFENRSLLRRMELTLAETQTLYDLNQALLAAQDPIELLRAIARHLAADADSIMHVVAARRRDGSEDVSVQHIITKRGEQVVNIPLRGMRTAGLLAAAGVEVTFIEDVDAAETAPLRDLLKERTRSYAAILARSNDRTADVVTIAYENPRTFDTRTRRLFTASADQLNIVLQNQRLLSEAQGNAERLSRQVRVLQSLNRLATGISSFQTERQLLDYITREMQETLAVDHVGVVLAMGDGETGMVVSEAPNQGSIGVTMELLLSPLVKTAIEQPNEPVIVQNVETDPRLGAQARAALRGIGTEAVMVIPLFVYGSFIGSIGFDLYERGRTFTQDMIEVAQTMTSQLAIGLQNVRLFTETQRRAEQMQSVAQFGQILQSSLDAETVIRALLTQSTAIIPFDQMSVALYDEAAKALRVVGLSEDGAVQVLMGRGALLSVADTSAGQVWTSGTTAYSSVPGGANGLGGSAIIAPIRSRDRRLGTVMIVANGMVAYSETDKAIFQQVVNLLAVALENAAAFSRSQQTARSEALVNEVTARFQQFTDIETLTTTAVRDLGRALGARMARVRLTTPTSIDSDPAAGTAGEE